MQEDAGGREIGAGSGNRENHSNYLIKLVLWEGSVMREAPHEAPKTTQHIGSRHFLGTEVMLIVSRYRYTRYQKRFWMSSNVDGLQRDTRRVLASRP